MPRWDTEPVLQSDLLTRSTNTQHGDFIFVRSQLWTFGKDRERSMSNIYLSKCNLKVIFVLYVKTKER